MCKLNQSKLRAAGYTAFEMCVANYIVDNDLWPGATFQGIPGHKRYGKSPEKIEVNENSSETLQFTRNTAREGLKVVTMDIATYSNGNNNNNKNPKKQNKMNNNNNNNNANNNNNMDINNMLASLFNQQQQAGYNKATQEYSEQIAALQKQIEELKQKGSGTIINVTIDGKQHKTETNNILNEHFEDVLELLASGSNVYLYGPAGSGKNVMCEQLAKTLGVEFYYQNTILTKFDLSGYTDANGNYQETEFYKAWKNGGLFMCDELDNSQAEAIIALNAALANGYFTFPGHGKLKKHPNFYCIAAGNTNGQGATEEYCGRYQMDESSRDRFAFVKVDYDSRIEDNICSEHKDVAEFVRELRTAANQLQIKLIAGYRAMNNLCKFYDKDTKFVLNAFVFRGMNKDDINQIFNNLTCKTNKYYKAIAEMLK